MLLTNHVTVRGEQGREAHEIGGVVTVTSGGAGRIIDLELEHKHV